MSGSNSSNGTSCFCPGEQEITLDDVDDVVAKLNSKVLQLRQEILSLRNSPGLQRDAGPGYKRPKIPNRESLDGREAREEKGSLSERRNVGSKFVKSSMPKLEKRFLRKNEPRFSVANKEIEAILEDRKPKQRSSKSVKSEEINFNREITNGRTKSLSSGRIIRDNSKNGISNGSSRERRKTCNRIFRENSKSENITVRKGEELGRNRIVVPLRVSTKCEGMRHEPTGSVFRRVKKKKISRGVQCEDSDDNKSYGLGGCFAFKCCARKSKRRKKLRYSEEKRKMIKSVGTFKSEIKNSVIPMGEKFVEKKTSNENGRKEEMRNVENLVPQKIEVIDDYQRHKNRTRLKREISKDNCIQNNDVVNVKKCLNECLHELNKIIDAGFTLRDQTK